MLDNGLLHEDVNTILGRGLRSFCREPRVVNGDLGWTDVQMETLDPDILRPFSNPFSPEGGLRLVTGNVGRAVVKVSAVDPSHHSITAPARVFDSQQAFVDAFNNDELERDFVAVVREQGPRANGMPELHKLTPYLGVLQNRGFQVALLTDGRMSGASGKVLSAIQVTPEAIAGGWIGKIRDDDLVSIDAEKGLLDVIADDFAARTTPTAASKVGTGMGRELFSAFRERANGAEEGASLFGVRSPG
jgi:phosphogluconate dehydratase